MCEVERNIEEIISNDTSIKFFVAGGIPYYLRLMSYFGSGNTADWRQIFKEFYKIQGLGESARNSIFDKFDSHRQECFNQPKLSDFLDDIKKRITGRIEISFVSKLLHTSNPDKYIIYDKHVANFFACSQSRHHNKAELYFNLMNKYKQLGKLSDCFDKLFNDEECKNITQNKKIDFMIWGWGKWKAFKDKYPLQDQ